MPTAPLPFFVGREEEFRRLEEAVSAWNTFQILVVEGPGGIGKSWFLEAVYRQRQEYVNLLEGRLRTSQVINLDDTRLQIPMNLGRRLAREVAAARFQPYLERTDEGVLLESRGLLSPEAIERVLHEYDRIFFQCYQEVARQERVLLILDAVEVILGLPLARYLVKLLTQLPNTVLLLGTREGERTTQLVSQAIQERTDAVVGRLPLAGFSAETTQDFFKQTAVGRYMATVPNLGENLRLLTEGRPLLLALAVEWLRRDIPFPELVEYSSTELNRLPAERLGPLQQEFEKAIAASFLKLAAPLPDLILNMACLVRRFDAEMYAAVTGQPLERCRTSLAGLLPDLFFVKQRPDESFVLHDEIQRLINTYIWPELDAFGSRRKQLGQAAVQNYEQRLARLKEETVALQGYLEDQTGRENLAKVAELHRQYVELRRTEWLYRREMLHYILQVDPARGYTLFLAGFDEASASYQYLFREGFVQEIVDRPLNLTPDQEYEVRRRLIRYQREKAEFDHAYEQARALLNTFPAEDERRIELMLDLANAAVRLNRLQTGNGWFKQAVESCDKYGITDKKYWAMTENGLGWSYRLLGQLDEAVLHYQRAFSYATETDNRELATSILNNLGYAYYLKGEKSKGLMFSRQALEVAQAMNLRHQVGAVNSTLGEIYLGMGRYTEAIDHYQAALEFFEETFNSEWQAIVHNELSHARRHMASLETADLPGEQQELLREALDHATMAVNLSEHYRLLKEMPLTYYEKGRVLLELGRLDEAEKYLEKSSPLNRGRPGGFGLADLSALAEIAYRKKDYDRVEALVQQAAGLPATQRADASLFYGRLLRVQAEAQLEQGQYNSAAATYVEALTHIARDGGYGAYRLDRELNQLRRLISTLPEEVKAAWCDCFIETWEVQPDRAEKHPEVVSAVQLARMM